MALFFIYLLFNEFKNSLNLCKSRDPEKISLKIASLLCFVEFKNL